MNAPIKIDTRGAGMTAKYVTVAVSAILVLAFTGFSSTGAKAGSMGPRCWIDFPLDGSTLDAATSYQIVAHSASPDTVSQTEFSINDKALGSISNQGGSLAVGRQPWQPGAAGQFTVQVRCRDGKGNWGDYASAKVTVTGAGPRLIVPGLQPPRLTLPSPGQAGTSFSDLNFSTEHIYYRGTGCGPKQVTLQVIITDQAGIDNVAIYFRLADQASQKTTDWSSLPMQVAAGRNTGETYCSTTINSESNIPSFSIYTSAWLQFYFKATNKAGVETNSGTYYQDVTLSGCTGNQVR
jgi:hypothetical protein